MSPTRRSTGTDLSPVTLQILLSLVGGPRHGYGIKLDIEQRTEGAVSLGSGTLYQALSRLEGQNLVSEAEPPEETDGDARRGRYYALSAVGRDALEQELASMRRTVSSEAARAILGAEGKV